MAKLNLTKLTDLTDKAATVNALNNNSELIEAAVENTLSRDGTIPNHMTGDLDMNSNDIMNVDQVDVQDIKLKGESISEAIQTATGEAVSDVEDARDSAIADVNQAGDDAKAQIADDIDLARKWANEDEDVVVDDGEFSSKHYSIKSSGFADDSAASAIAAQTARTGSEAARDLALQYRDTTKDHLDEFKGRYYGPLSADPSVDPNGNAPTAGDFYFRTSDAVWR